MDCKAHSEENNIKTKTANIMVVGKTGTGKSTLLNAIFGEELAATGIGRPVTDHISDYQHENIPIHIWDTVGLELDSEKTRQSIDEIKKTIVMKSESKDELDQIHAIWYCINSGSNRYEGIELEFIKELYSIGVPFIIVLTQCYGAKKKISEFEDAIKGINKRMNMTDIHIMRVLAQEYEIEIDEDQIITKSAFGLEELINFTVNQLPSYVHRSFIAAQKVSETLKHEECEKLIWEYVQRVLDNYWSKWKILNLDNVPIVNFLTTDGHIKDLFKEMSRIYNTEIPEEKLAGIMFELGGLSPKNAFLGLLIPLSKKFDENVEQLFEKNTNGNFNDKFSLLSKSQRVARMIILYGYTFLKAIEASWEEIRKNKIADLDKRADIFVKNIRGTLKKFWSTENVKSQEQKGDLI